MPTVTFLFISDSSFECDTPKRDVLRLRTLKELQIASLKVVIDYHEMCGFSTVSLFILGDFRVCIIV